MEAKHLVGSCGVSLLLWAIIFAVAVSLSGCGFLVTEADLWGAKFKFPAGYSVEAGANTVDKVDNRKGLNKW